MTEEERQALAIEEIKNGSAGLGITFTDYETGETNKVSYPEAQKMGFGSSILSTTIPYYKVGNSYSPNEPTTATISLDKLTGDINITAPSSAVNTPEFKEQLDSFKTYSGNYKVNPEAEYTLKNSDGTTESISLEEYINRLNTPTDTGEKDRQGNAIKMSPFQTQVNQYLYANMVREFLAPNYQYIDENGDIKPIDITLEDIIKMSTNGLGADVKDNTRLVIPKGIDAFEKAGLYSDEDWSSLDDSSGSTTIKKFQDLWYNREKTDQQAILTVYGDLGRYLQKVSQNPSLAENVNVDKFTATYALFTYLSETDPTCSLFRGSWDFISGFVNAAGQAATNYIILGTQGVANVVEKAVDLTANLYETGLSENPFRDRADTDFDSWAETVQEVMDTKYWAQYWGYGFGSFEKAYNDKAQLDQMKQDLRSIMGIGVDATTATRLRTEGADPQLNSAADAFRAVSTSLIQLAVAIHVGNVASEAVVGATTKAAAALKDLAYSDLTTSVSGGMKILVPILGAEGTSSLLNFTSNLLMTPVVSGGLGLIGESIGEAIFQSPEVLTQILRSDDLTPEAQQYLWDTYTGNAAGLILATGISKTARALGTTARGQAISRNVRNWVWDKQAAIADSIDAIRIKLSGSADVIDWLDKIGSKGLTDSSKAAYARKEAVMAQQRVLRRARQAIAENSPSIKILGENTESILKQIDEADKQIDALMKVESALDDLARGNNYRKLTMLDDHPMFEAADTELRKISGDLVDLQAKSGLKAAEKVGDLKLFNKQVSEYVNARLRTDIANSALETAKLSKATNATEKIDAIQKEVTHWSGIIENFQKAYSDLAAKADEYVDATKRWWQQFNDVRKEMGLISDIDIQKWREEGIWGQDGELYARQQRKQEQKDYLIKRRDGRVERKLERDMGHYNWGSTEEFVDPMLVAQQEFEMAAEQANRIQLEKNYSDITGTATVKKDAANVRIAKEVKPYLKAYNDEVHQNIKPLVAEMDTDGIFNESIRAHQLRQEAGQAETAARQIERTRISRRTPTMGEMQSTVQKLDEGSIETLWGEVYGDKTAEQVIAETQARGVTFYRGQQGAPTSFQLNDSSRVSDTIGQGYYVTTDAPYAIPFGDNMLTFGAEQNAILEASEVTEIQKAAKKQNANKTFMQNLEKTDPEMAVTVTKAAHGDLQSIAVLGEKPIIATRNPNTMPVADGSTMRKATEYVYYRGVREDLDELFDNQISATPSKRVLLANNDATRKAPYMKNQVMEARQMEYDAIMRDGYSEAAERAATLSAEAVAQEELVYDMASKALDDFSETFFAKGTNANKVADEMMMRYGGNAPEALGEYLYYDALKKNKASLAREVKAQAKKAFENYEVEVDGKITHPYKQKAEYLANKISKNVSDQVEVRFNASRVTVSNMGGDAAKLLDHDSWQREIYETANEIYELKHTNNVIAIPNASGETELVEVDPLLAIFVNSTTQSSQMGMLGRGNYLWMRLFRLGTTGLNPTSWVNQYYRDLGNAWVMGNISETLSGATETLTEIFGQDAGVLLSQYSQEVQENLLKIAQEQNKSIARVMAEKEIRRGALYAKASSESEVTRLWRGTRNQWLVDGANRGAWDKTMDALDKFEEKATIVNETREKYLRNLVYGNNFAEAIKGGKSIEQARIFAEYIASNATTNFTRGVAFMSQFQNTIPYFRSAINGTRSFYRLWSLDPVGVTGRIIGGLVVPAFALTMASLSTEENRQAYSKIQAYQKEDSLPIVMNGEAFFIPLPQELWAFIAPFRQAAEAINGLGYNNALEVTVNDLLALSPVDFGGFTDIDSWRIYGEGPDWTERLTSGSAQLFSQIMPKWAVALATVASGRDLYTGNKIDTSYVTVDPDTGEQQVMTYTAGVIANQLNKVFPNLPAPIAQEMLENVFGTAGTQLMNFLVDIIGQTATFNFDYASAGQQLATDVIQDLSKPMRPYVEARESADWRHAMSDLWDLKNDILSPNTSQGQAWQAMLNNRRNATTQTERDAVATARANILDPFHKQVMETVGDLIKADPTAFTDIKLASVLSLLNFGSINDSVNAATDQYGTDLYKQSKYAAVETMVNMGFPNVNTPSILGSIKVNQSGDSYIQWNTPLQILDMENTIYAQGAIYAADIKNRLAKNGIDNAARSAAFDAYYAETDKNKKKQIAIDWDTKVATAIAPYVQQYGAESITNSNDVIDLLDGYLLIPTDYMRYKGKSTYNPKVNAARGYSKQFLKDVFGAKK